MPALPNIQDEQLKTLLEYLQTDKDPLATATATEEQSKPTTSPETNPALIRGAHLYDHNCAICHGDKREGIVPSFPALIGIGSRMTDPQILALIHSGKGRMPGFPKLAANDLDDLMHFLRPLNTNQETPAAEAQYTMTGYRRFLDPDGYPATATPWGTLSALDLNTGKYLWQVPLGQYPELAAKGLPDTGSENYGGPVVTAGGLIFIAATNFDHKLRAFDKTTGKLLWETILPFAGNATPATYEVDGRQYIVIAAGGSSMNPRGPIGGVYMAFALPK
jgi:quinoprotein glucose dehydrogenase